MRWLGVTVALLAASAFLAVGIYLRDRHFSDWRPSQSALAHADARTLLATLEGYHCHRHCNYQLISHVGGHHWLARINVRSRALCVNIDVAAFAFNPPDHLSGVEQIRCSTAASARAA